jgi:hypothetical protein
VTDLVQELREYAQNEDSAEADAAADEIERLRAALQELVTAIEPSGASSAPCCVPWEMFLRAKSVLA